MCVCVCFLVRSGIFSVYNVPIHHSVIDFVALIIVV